MDSQTKLNSEKKIEFKFNLERRQDCFYFLNVEWEEGKREKGFILNSTTLKSFFLYFIFRKIRGEERREFILNSTPRILFWFFVFYLFEKSEEYKRKLFLFLNVKSGGVRGGAAPPILPVVEWEGEKREGLALLECRCEAAADSVFPKGKIYQGEDVIAPGGRAG